jgi:WD40 repeat protein
MLALDSGTSESKRAVTLWDVATGRLLASAPALGVYYLEFTPDGRELIVSGPPSATIWRLNGFLPVSLAGHTAGTRAVAFSPDGRRLATAGDETGHMQMIKIWDLASARAIHEWDGREGTVGELAFSADGKWLASAHRAEKHIVGLWDAATSQLVARLAGHSQETRAVAFSPDGTLLASGGHDGIVRLWEVAQGSYRKVDWRHAGPVEDVAFSPDGTLVASAGRDGVRLWDVGTGKPRAALPDVKARAVWFAPASPTSSDRGTPQRLTIGRGSPDGAGSYRDTTDRLWGSVVGGGSVPRPYASQSLTAIELRVADEAGTSTLWEPFTSTTTAVQLPSGAPAGAAGELEALVFAPDGSTIAAAGKSGKIHLLDTLTGQEILTLEGGQKEVNDLAFSPDGSTIAACSQDGSVKLWHSGR